MRRELSRVTLGPGGRRCNWLVRAAARTRAACRRREILGGAQQPVVVDLVGSNRDVVEELEVEAEDEEGEGELVRRKRSRGVP